MKNVIIVLCAIAMFFLTSCSSDPTTEAKKVVEKRLEVDKGYLRIADFKKTDAVERTVEGVKQYELKYISDVEVIKAGGWLNIWLRGGKLDTSFMIEKINYSGNDFYYIEAQLGTRYKNKGLVILEKHENGWVDITPR